MLDATENGARIFTYCEVKDLIQEGGRVIGVSVYDHKYKINRQFLPQWWSMPVGFGDKVLPLMQI